MSLSPGSSDFLSWCWAGYFRTATHLIEFVERRIVMLPTSDSQVIFLVGNIETHSSCWLLEMLADCTSSEDIFDSFRLHSNSQLAFFFFWWIASISWLWIFGRWLEANDQRSEVVVSFDLCTLVISAAFSPFLKGWVCWSAWSYWSFELIFFTMSTWMTLPGW